MPMANMKLTENKYYKKAKRKASDIIGDKDKMNELVSSSKEKLDTINFENSKVRKLAFNLRIIGRMIKAYVDGSYRLLPWKSLLALISGVVYFLMPLDLLPDFIPVTGFLDDFTVIMLITGAFQQDIEAFIEWEEDHN